MNRSPTRISPWNTAKARPIRLTCWWISNAVGPPGQTLAILLVMMRPKTIDAQSRTYASKALDSARYQYALGSGPRRELDNPRTTPGRTKTAPNAPPTAAKSIRLRVVRGIDGRSSYSWSFTIPVMSTPEVRLHPLALQHFFRLEHEQAGHRTSLVQPRQAILAAENSHDFGGYLGFKSCRTDDSHAEDVRLRRKPRPRIDEVVTPISVYFPASVVTP